MLRDLRPGKRLCLRSSSTGLALTPSDSDSFIRASHREAWARRAV